MFGDAHVSVTKIKTAERWKKMRLNAKFGRNTVALALNHREHLQRERERTLEEMVPLPPSRVPVRFRCPI